MSNQRVIVTGVSGQDGSIMVDYLLRNTDAQIFGVVRRAAKPDYSNLIDALTNDRFKLVTADLSDSSSISNLVREVLPDYFINFAAQSFVKASWDVPEQTLDVNATGVARCLESIRTLRPSCRFYNAGSSEEFGDVQYSPQDEKHPLRARSPYGASKISARQIVKTYRDSYNLYAIQGILFNHESERRGEEFVTRKITKGVSRIYKAIQSGKSFEPIVLGNLESQRDWSHAEDFVDGIWKMLNQPILQKTDGVEHQIGTCCGSIIDYTPKEYVLASGETHTIREFIELAFNKAGIIIENVNPECIPPARENPANGRQINYQTKDGYPLVVVSSKFYRPAEVDLLWGDASLARKELGWTPKISFDKLVKRMVVSDLNELGISLDEPKSTECCGGGCGCHQS